MTVEVDFDRLADYVGGALDGTPDADHVRDLIASDAAWEAAYTELMAADVTVRADLAAFGARPADMPPDVATRLDGLLLRLAADEPVGVPSRRVDAGRPDTARRDGTRPDGRRVTRRARMVAVLSAAAAVVAVGLGLFALVPQSYRGGESASDSGAAAPQLPGAEGGAVQNQAIPEATVLSSGRDYQRGGFGPLVTAAPARPPNDTAATGKAVAGNQRSEFDAAPVPPALTRLADPVTRAACLSAVTRKHGGIPRTVDLASFEGRPAMVVLLDGSRTGAGAPWVVVVGPGCGQPVGEIDELYNGAPG